MYQKIFFRGNTSSERVPAIQLYQKCTIGVVAYANMIEVNFGKILFVVQKVH